jgi:hypothetical protein
MRLKKIVEPADAVAVIHAGDTVASAGYAGSGTPDQLFISIEQRFHYERFSCDDDAFDEYIELVKRVEQTHYRSVKRYTSGAFLRHKLGTGLARRHISSEMIDSTRRNLRQE